MQRRNLAVLGGSEGEPLYLITAMVSTLQGLGPSLGVLDRLAQLLGHGKGNELLGCDLQLPAEPTADIRRDDPDLALGGVRGKRGKDAQEVRHLGGRPEDELLTTGVDYVGSRFHERRNQPLLPEGPLKHDAVAPSLLDLVFDVGAGACLG